MGLCVGYRDAALGGGFWVGRDIAKRKLQNFRCQSIAGIVKAAEERARREAEAERKLAQEKAKAQEADDVDSDAGATA